MVPCLQLQNFQGALKSQITFNQLNKPINDVFNSTAHCRLTVLFLLVSHFQLCKLQTHRLQLLFNLSKTSSCQIIAFNNSSKSNL